MVDPVYTIGYSGFAIDEFVHALTERRISLLVDVRSQPHSRYFPAYNRETLARKLESNGVHYRNDAEEFGARQSERRYYADKGYLDFALFAQSARFLGGVQRLISCMARGYRFALMCAEKDPMNCHRAILVARAFHDAGYNVIHLLPGGAEMTQGDMEKRLADKYFPARNQISLFDEALSEKDYIALAYERRNAEIGYSIAGEAQPFDQ